LKPREQSGFNFETAGLDYFKQKRRR